MPNRDLKEETLSDLSSIARTLRMSGREDVAYIASALESLVAGQPIPAPAPAVVEETQPTTPDLFAVVANTDDEANDEIVATREEVEEVAQQEVAIIRLEDGYEDEDDEYEDDYEAEPVVNQINVVISALPLDQAENAVAAVKENLGQFGEVELGATRYVENDLVLSGTITAEVQYPGGIPLVDGVLPIGDGLIHVHVDVPVGEGEEGFPTPEQYSERLREVLTEQDAVAPTTLQAIFSKEGGVLDGVELQTTLTLAEETLRRFGNLAVLNTEVKDEETLVTYAILEEGAYSTAMIGAAAGWGGRINIPNVGFVQARLNVA